MGRLGAVILSVLLVLAVGTAGAAAEEGATGDAGSGGGAGADGTVSVELNKLEPTDNGCRAYLLLHNGTGAPFTSLEFDLVMFDAEGVVARRVALETAPLAAGKTRLKVFDLSDLQCGGISRVLLNGVLACAGPSGRRDGCLDAVRVSSKAGVPLVE